jgi:orotate phosphoribosyltransferase
LPDDLLSLLAARRGHFRLESGHHGELWLELERLCLRPARVRPFAAKLARLLKPYHIEAVCGPLNEGAFVALMVAEELGVDFTYAERIAATGRAGLFPVDYRLPGPLRERVRGRRVAVVNDVINAGSAVRGTFADLQACDAVPVALASLVVLGDFAMRLAGEWKIPLLHLSQFPNPLWTAGDCPLCAAGVALSGLGETARTGNSVATGPMGTDQV